MKRHTQTYFDLNPKPTARKIVLDALLWAGYALYAVGMVYFTTIMLFSF